MGFYYKTSLCSFDFLDDMFVMTIVNNCKLVTLSVISLRVSVSNAESHLITLAHVNIIFSCIVLTLKINLIPIKFTHQFIIEALQSVESCYSINYLKKSSITTLYKLPKTTLCKYLIVACKYIATCTCCTHILTDSECI